MLYSLGLKSKKLILIFIVLHFISIYSKVTIVYGVNPTEELKELLEQVQAAKEKYTTANAEYTTATESLEEAKNKVQEAQTSFDKVIEENDKVKKAKENLEKAKTKGDDAQIQKANEALEKAQRQALNSPQAKTARTKLSLTKKYEKNVQIQFDQAKQALDNATVTLEKAEKAVKEVEERINKEPDNQGNEDTTDQGSNGDNKNQGNEDTTDQGSSGDNKNQGNEDTTDQGNRNNESQDDNKTKKQDSKKSEEKNKKAIHNNTEQKANRELESQITTQQAINKISDQLNIIVSTRFNAFYSISSPTAISSGDDNHVFKSGIWLIPFISKGTKKEYKGYSNYKANSKGLTIGYDTIINDNNIIGGAVTYGNSFITYKKDIKQSDKTKLKTWLMSLYYGHQFKNNNFVNATFSVGNSKIHDSTNYLINQNKISTTAKYTAYHQSIEIIGGHNVKYNNKIFLTPILGIKSIRISPKVYTRYIDINNYDCIKNKLVSKSEAVIGIKTTKFINYKDYIKIAPSLYAFINYTFNNRVAKTFIIYSASSQTLNVQAPKLSKLSYNIGTPLMAKLKRLEYGVIYDAALAPKYQNHTIAFKVKVKF